MPHWTSAARPVLDRMISTIQHRGPDDIGFLTDSGVGLAHARLSIIDLSTGHQPMANEDQTLWVVFNGEIFNYLELRDHLQSRGHLFRTHSDTETILHAYEETGTACPELFNGDFAFAIWDKPNDRLLLARDRMGVRPLYYAQLNGGLVFASEIKSILAAPEITAEIDPVAINQCFTFWFPLAPITPFKGIRELPPGHVLVAQNARVVVSPYWKLRYPAIGQPTDLHGLTQTQIAEQLHDLLIHATRIRLRADVPVGAYLSGGLDSSAIVAMIKLFTSNRLRTFSVGFESEEFDETRYQRQVVQFLGTDHQSITCTRQDIARIFPDVIRHTERPIIRTAPAPLFALSQFVRQNNFKVVLTGEGADEILAGYDIFKEAKIRRFWSHQPRSHWRALLLRRLYPYLSGLQGQPQAYLQAFFRVGLDTPDDPLFSHLPRFTMTARINGLLSDDLRNTLADYDPLDDLRGRLPPDFHSWHPLSQAQYLETAYLLPGYILSSQGDRVSMAHAVEGRFPFLDHRVVEFANLIPPHMKLKGLTEKHILRQSIGRYLPPAIARRPKQPYRAPDSECFFSENPPDYVQDLLSPASIRDTGYFNPNLVDKLVRKCRTAVGIGFRDNMALVGILSVQLLHQTFIRHAGPTSLSSLHCATV